jgi:hypothetical protein
MRSLRRLITKELKATDFKCDLAPEELICEDCGVVMKYTMQMIGKRMYCKDCSPWYKEQFEIDQLALEADLLRAAGVSTPRRATEEIEAELDYGERDYWD